MTLSFSEVHLSQDRYRRYLHLGGTQWIQGSMRIRKPFDIDLEYCQRMMAWMLWWDEQDQPLPHVVQLGLGAGALTKFCYHHLQAVVTAVELNPQVIRVCHQHFKLPFNDERLNVTCCPAQDWVASEQHHGIAEVLQIDLYDQDAQGPVLDSLEFYEQCAKVMTPNGTLTLNLFGKHSSFKRNIKHVLQAFSHGKVWVFDPTQEGNTVLIARHDPCDDLDLSVMNKRAQQLQQQWKWPAVHWPSILRPYGA